MKKYVFLSFFLYSIYGFSQGNLQFNQVKLVSTLETVPTGKIWKIESVTYSAALPYIGGSGTAATEAKIIINSILQSVRGFTSANNSGAAVWEQSFPIWLPSGTTLAASTEVNYINVIEFNVVP